MYLCEAKFSFPILLPTLSDSDLQVDDLDTAIRLPFDEQLFAFIRELVWLTRLPRTTLHQWLTDSLRFHVRHLRWVPHILSESQNVARVTRLRKLLQMLNQQSVRSWHDIVTLDKS
jgi:hypothetical protein